MSWFESIFRKSFNSWKSKFWKAFESWVDLNQSSGKLFESWIDLNWNSTKPFESWVDLNQIPENHFELWDDLNHFLQAILSHELSQNQNFLGLSWIESRKWAVPMFAKQAAQIGNYHFWVKLWSSHLFASDNIHFWWEDFNKTWIWIVGWPLF